MTPDTTHEVPLRDQLPFMNRNGRRSLVAKMRKSKRKGPNFTKPKSRK